VALIALLDDGKSFFAIERELRGLYALCKLGSWVDLNRLCAAAIVSRHLPLENKKQSTPKGTCETPITAETSKYNKEKRLAIEAIQSMVKRPPGGILSTPEALLVCESHPAGTRNLLLQEGTTGRCPSQSSSLLDLSHQMEASPATQHQPRVTPDPTRQDPSDCHVERGDVVEQSLTDRILQNIRSQYLEALYLSKVGVFPP
jgi:DNA replication regulator SLD3